MLSSPHFQQLAKSNLIQGAFLFHSSYFLDLYEGRPHPKKPKARNMLSNGAWFETVGPINNLLFEKPYCGGMVIIVTFQNVVDQILTAML